MPVYRVSDFSDNELYQLLDIPSPNPSDGELEARIIQMLQKHMYLRTQSGQQLFQFFKDIYAHFFDLSKTTDLEKRNYDSTPEKTANFNNRNNLDSGLKLERDDLQNQLNEIRDANLSSSKANNEAKNNEVKNNVAFTRELVFAPGKINPLLKETYTRTISIDSQYRDQEYSSATDFTVNFNETLKDVVKMKLYAVQIPVTWYTISNSYGSNFFYLKPREVQSGSYNTLGIYGKSSHEYKIYIRAGNYDSQELVNAITRGISLAGEIYLDVSFGNTKIEYDKHTVTTAFTFDIRKVYNEFSYSVSYGPSCRALLGIRDTSNVPVTTIFTDFSSSDFNMNDSWPPVELNDPQRTFTLSQYDSIESFNTKKPALHVISIKLDGARKTWREWIQSIDNTVKNHDELIDSSFKCIETSGNSYFEWNLKPNRAKFKTSTVVGSRWFLQRYEGGEPGIGVNLGYLLYNTSTGFGSQVSSKKYLADVSMNISGEQVVFRPMKDDLGGVYISDEDDSNNISFDIPARFYTALELKTKLNNLFDANPILKGSTWSDDPIKQVISPSYRINKIYTSRDYKVVFYDINSFSKCTNSSASYRNATIDTTLGYILGFHTAAEYEFNQSNPTNSIESKDIVNTNGNTTNTIVTLLSDAVVNVYLYTYFMIILDDFNQNHLNDGLVTLSKRDYSVTLPSYANRKLAKQCNPVTNTVSNTVSAVNNLTQKQAYSVEQILAEQDRQRDFFNQGVYVRDMFALLPVKTSGVVPGSIYVEFGGTLQQQERVYFGPVNIRRIAVKLVNDKGDVVDLNGGNWSFQLVCEQLYQRGEPS